METQVAIVGAGPAGLLLSHLLHLKGIDSVVLEHRSRSHVEGRIRAGVLEQMTVDVLRATGVADRMDREGMRHEGIELAFAGRRHRIDLADLTDGKAVTVYGQHEVVRDLIARRLADQGTILFDVAEVGLHAIDGTRPWVTFRDPDGVARRLDCAIIAGCDGFHGVSRAAIPAHALTVHERVYPFAWLGVLADAAPAQEELIYAHHADGFALFSMRSPTITRLYLQCAPDEDLNNWPDDRIWAALQDRLAGDGAFRLTEGPILQKGVTGMRSFIAAPMRHGRLVLAGDAAHIVPPTGAKGMNLAVADVQVLTRALVALLKRGQDDLLNRYSDLCLRRIWTVSRFSWWMTQMLHRFDDHDAFADRMQLAELEYLTSSRNAARVLAENYVGLPLELPV